MVQNNDSTTIKPFLTGIKVYLRAVASGDYLFLTNWLNDSDVTYFMFYGQFPKTYEQIKEHFEKQLSDQANAVFIVTDKKSRRPIGFAGLYEIHPTARSAEFRIVIGEKNFWGKNYGTEIAQLVIFYGFDRLNLNRIYLGVTAENKAAISTYKKVGFVQEGILREDIFRNSRFYDTVRMSILHKDYHKNLFQKQLKSNGSKKI